MTPDTLIISGGGPDGLAFIGALEVIETSYGMASIRNIIGCSIGAIFGVLIAAGMKSDDLRQWVIQGMHLGLHRLDLAGIFHLNTTLGMDDGSKFVKHLHNGLRAKLGESITTDITLCEFVKRTGINVTIVTTNVTKMTRELLNVDTSPNIPILTAVKMSFSIPFMFKPVTWNDSIYVDGGILDNCPAAHIITSGKATAAIVLNITNNRDIATNSPASNMPPQQSMSIGTFIVRIISLVTMRQHVIPCQRHDQHPTLLYVIDIPSRFEELCPFNLRTMALQISEDALTRYIDHGRECAHMALKGFCEAIVDEQE